MIKASVIGGTGYAGQELIRILMRHPEVEVVTIGTRSFSGQKFSDVYGNFESITDLVCQTTDITVLA
ncbi:MAG: N-acetyl-gamma-glutamyl-phosphate reductase, partial [Acetobacterium sp.]|nr:N-acetyl-gamma-glutamyl-phosphate reductase [Acetobacterium sp.]